MNLSAQIGDLPARVLHTPASRPSYVNRVLFYGLICLLLFGPLAFGATQPWALWILEIGSALLFALWTVAAMAGRVEVRWNPLFVPMLAFAALVATQVVFRRSAYLYATEVSALQYCAYGLLCFLAAQTISSERRVRQAGLIATGYGLAVALFALLQSIIPNGKFYWLVTPSRPSRMYGPYYNHNHYAGLMEMLAPIPLVYALSSQVQGAKRGAAAAAGIFMAATIFLSGSRGGMIAFLVEVAVLCSVALKSGSLTLPTTRRGKKTRSAPVLLVAMALLFGLVFWLGGNEFAHRFSSIHSEAQHEISGGTRLTIDRDSLRMWRQRPLLGWGLGAFPVAYPQFRTFYTNLFVNQAHNDPLQLLVETGTVGFAVGVWFLAVVFRQGIRKLENWAVDLNGTLAFACLLGIIGLLVHGFVDFNLQIPANAAIFYVLATLAAAPLDTCQQLAGIPFRN
jgi:O-antigen ligase